MEEDVLQAENPDKQKESHALPCPSRYFYFSILLLLFSILLLLYKRVLRLLCQFFLLLLKQRVIKF